MLSNQIVVTQLTAITVLLINDSHSPPPEYCWIILQAGKPRKLAYGFKKNGEITLHCLCSL